MYKCLIFSFKSVRESKWKEKRKWIPMCKQYTKLHYHYFHQAIISSNSICFDYWQNIVVIGPWEGLCTIFQINSLSFFKAGIVCMYFSHLNFPTKLLPSSNAMRGLNDISLEAHRKTQFCFHQSRPKYSNNFFLLDFEFCEINLSLKIYFETSAKLSLSIKYCCL